MLGGEQVVESTGCVMVPYQQYPNLMGTLLLMLADRNNETLRYPVIIVSHLCLQRSIPTRHLVHRGCCNRSAGRSASPACPDQSGGLP